MIRGIWFYGEDECKRLYNLFNILRKAQNSPSKALQLPFAVSAEPQATPSTQEPVDEEELKNPEEIDIPEDIEEPEGEEETEELEDAEGPEEPEDSDEKYDISLG